MRRPSGGACYILGDDSIYLRHGEQAVHHLGRGRECLFPGQALQRHVRLVGAKDVRRVGDVSRRRHVRPRRW